MTKPETEWVWVPREPTDGMQVYFWRCYNEQQPGTALSIKFRRAFMEMLAAAPPAPSVPDVVREWEARRAATRKYEGSREAQTNEIGDRMAAALTAQAKELQQAAQAGIDFGVKLAAERATVTELRAEVERLTGEAEAARETLEDEQVAHTETLRLWKIAEAALETARGALEKMKSAADALRMHVPGYHENDAKHERIHAAFAQHLSALADYHAALPSKQGEDGE